MSFNPLGFSYLFPCSDIDKSFQVPSKWLNSLLNGKDGVADKMPNCL